MTRAMDAAIVARLREDPELEVFEGEILRQEVRPVRYVTVWTSGGARSTDRFDGGQRNVTKTYTIHSIGQNKAQAAWVQEHVMAKLVDFRPVLPERSAQRLKHEVSRPMRVEQETTPWVHYYVDEFDLFTTPSGGTP